jgi:hypothetical protein
VKFPVIKNKIIIIKVGLSRKTVGAELPILPIDHSLEMCWATCPSPKSSKVQACSGRSL